MKRLLLIVAGMVLAAGAAVLVVGPGAERGPAADADVASASDTVVDPDPDSDPDPESTPVPGDEDPEPSPEPVPEAPDEPANEAPEDPIAEPADPALAEIVDLGDDGFEPGSILPVGEGLFDDQEGNALVWSFDTRAYAERFLEFVSSRTERDLGLELVSSDDHAWQVRVPYLDEHDREARLDEIERVTGFDLSQGRP